MNHREGEGAKAWGEGVATEERCEGVVCETLGRGCGRMARLAD